MPIFFLLLSFAGAKGQGFVMPKFDTLMIDGRQVTLGEFDENGVMRSRFGEWCGQVKHCDFYDEQGRLILSGDFYRNFIYTYEYIDSLVITKQYESVNSKKDVFLLTYIQKTYYENGRKARELSYAVDKCYTSSSDCIHLSVPTLYEDTKYDVDGNVIWQNRAPNTREWKAVIRSFLLDDGTRREVEYVRYDTSRIWRECFYYTNGDRREIKYNKDVEECFYYKNGDVKRYKNGHLDYRLITEKNQKTLMDDHGEYGVYEDKDYFDDRGNIIKRLNFYNGKIVAKHIYEYDDDSKRIFEQFLYPYANNPNKWMVKEENKYTYNKYGGLECEYRRVYNKYTKCYREDTIYYNEKRKYRPLPNIDSAFNRQLYDIKFIKSLLVNDVQGECEKIDKTLKPQWQDSVIKNDTLFLYGYDAENRHIKTTVCLYDSMFYNPWRGSYCVDFLYDEKQRISEIRLYKIYGLSSCEGILMEAKIVYVYRHRKVQMQKYIRRSVEQEDYFYEYANKKFEELVAKIKTCTKSGHILLEQRRESGDIRPLGW